MHVVHFKCIGGTRCKLVTGTTTLAKKITPIPHCTGVLIVEKAAYTDKLLVVDSSTNISKGLSL
jgi:hypothetical protein